MHICEIGSKDMVRCQWQCFTSFSSKPTKSWVKT